MSKRSSLKLPREHGAWVMLYVPFAAGALVAWGAPARLLLLGLSVTFVFVAHESILLWYRARRRGRQNNEALRFSLGYLALAGGFGAPLVLIHHMYWFIAMGAIAAMSLAVNTRLAVRHEDHTIVGEMMAIAGLTMTAPASVYAVRGELEVTALLLWVMCIVYFASSVFYVKFRVSAMNPRLDLARRSWLQCAGYHSLLLVSLIWILVSGGLTIFTLAAFAPIVARSFWALVRPVRRVNLRLVGLLEIVYSLAFLIFTTLNFRL